MTNQNCILNSEEKILSRESFTTTPPTLLSAKAKNKLYLTVWQTFFLDDVVSCQISSSNFRITLTFAHLPKAKTNMMSCRWNVDLLLSACSHAHDGYHVHSLVGPLVVRVLRTKRYSTSLHDVIKHINSGAICKNELKRNK